MKAHLITVLAVDHDELEAKATVETICDARYPNHCISPQAVNVKTFEIGEWSDEHPLNLGSTDVLTWLRENS